MSGNFSVRRRLRLQIAEWWLLPTMPKRFAVPVHSEDAVPLGVITFFTALSKRVRVKRKLHELETRIREFRLCDIGVTGNQNNGNRRELSKHGPRQRNPVHYWHLDIRHQQVHSPIELVQ
jgi:hypothetical protein